MLVFVISSSLESRSGPLRLARANKRFFFRANLFLSFSDNGGSIGIQTASPA